MKSSILFITVFIFSTLLPSCATSPMGRKQMLLMPESQMVSMGVKSFEELKKTTPIEKDPKINAYIKCITDPLTRAAGPVEGVQSWEVVVFRDPQVNAFALPGGKIGVYTGIIKVANTPSQLAAVLGHEIGHVMAKHGNERVSQGLATQVALQGTAFALKKNGKINKKTQLIVAALGIGLQFGVTLPFSRTHESEADIIGLELMSKAGFDPEQSLVLWQNMSRASGKAPPEWMSTHPSNKTRIENLSKNIPRYEPFYEKAKENNSTPHCQL